MDIVITDWEQESKIDLIHKLVFTREEYEEIFLPDIKRLKEYPRDERFKQSKFWGRATINSHWIDNGYKMKWHNIGSGRVQLRLAVALIYGRAILCQWYVKKDDKVDKKEMLRFKTKIHMIQNNNFMERGEI